MFQVGNCNTTPTHTMIRRMKKALILYLAISTTTLAAAEKAGGTLALPKMPVPGIGWLAYMKDTEGNIFGMIQADTAAA